MFMGALILANLRRFSLDQSLQVVSSAVRQPAAVPRIVAQRDASSQGGRQADEGVAARSLDSALPRSGFRPTSSARVVPWGLVGGGAFFSLTSPGFLVWWATIGASVFLKGVWHGPSGLALVAIGHAIADIGWCWFIAFSVERGRSYYTDRIYRLTMMLIAACLMLLGIGMFVSNPSQAFWDLR